MKIKTWEKRLDELPDMMIITHEAVRTMMAEEIYDLRMALNNAEAQNKQIVRTLERILKEIRA